MDIDDFAEVQEALWEARFKWYNIGIRLKLKVPDLNCIKFEPGIDLEEKFNRMINSWLNMGESCTWPTLCGALTHPTVAMPNVAEEVMRVRVGIPTGEL